MPRNRGGGRPAPRAPARRPAPPPAPVHHAPPPAPVQSAPGGGMMSGLAGAVAQGMALGTGSAMAHRAMDGLMGPRVVQHEVAESASSASAQPASPALTTVSADACNNQMKAFQDCVSANDSDIGRCQFYLDMLNQCRRGPSSSVML